MAKENARLNELLNKQKATPPKEDGESPKRSRRFAILADGSKIDLDELNPEDKQSRRYFIKRGKERQQRYLPSTFIVPDYIKKALECDKDLTENQRRYKKDVFDKKSLNVTAPNKQKSGNPQGLSRYIFWTEFVACKNGFLYYTLPLLVSIAFFCLHITLHDFWVNALFSLLTLFDIIALRYAIKNVPQPGNKVIIILMILAINVGLYYLAAQFPEWLEGLEIFFAVRMLLIVFAVYHFGKFYAYFAIMYASDCKLDFGNTVQIKAGKPRCGKTSSAVHESIILAKMKWTELVFDYWEKTSNEDEIFKNGSMLDKLELAEIKLSYEFYIKQPCSPCLWSNIGIFDKKGRASHKITLNHIKGIDRLPLYSVVVLDEIGAMLKADDGLNRSGIEKPLDISDMFRLGGHFLKWVVIGCEQDFNHIFIDCRRVVGFNQVIQGQEWVCQPRLILAIYKFLKFLKSDGLDKTMTKNPKWATFMKRFKKLVYSIGFRRVKFGYATNTQTDAGMTAANADTELVTISGNKTRYYPSNLAGDYDDRAYKQKYPAYFDKVIRGELHKYKSIEHIDDNTSVFVNVTEALTEKREAQIEQIKSLFDSTEKIA